MNEFLIVRLYGYGNGSGVHVLVNGKPNGYVNDVIMLRTGWVEISADVPGATAQKVYLSDTTFEKPMEVLIHVLPQQS